MQDFEALAVFCLGRAVDIRTGAPAAALLPHDSRGLTTQAVCILRSGGQP